MSSYAAVGAVSNTLKTLLVDRLDVPPGQAGPIAVAVGPPPEDPAVIAEPLVNVFLYRVCENGALQNQELVGHGNPGAYGRPPLALDLHYLVTAYGETSVPASDELKDELIAHYLLGSAMRVLHDYAIVTPTLETKNGFQVLDKDLLDAREQVKVSLQPLSLEDLSKVWTALSRPFRASAAYEVTVVQIEPVPRGPNPQPVGPQGALSGPHVKAVAGLTPVIEGIHAAGRAGAQVRAGETIVLEGSGLLGEATEVDLAGHRGLGVVTSARPDRLTFVIPDDPRLDPGVVPVRVTHGVNFGDPPERRPTFSSNTVACAVVPRVDGVAIVGGVVGITGDRLVAPGVPCLAVIGGVTVEEPAYVVARRDEVTFPVPDGLEPGVPVRVFVRVDGVQSIDAVTVTP